MATYIRELRKLAEAYGRAEAEIVRAYFRTPRSSTEHSRWLKAQAFKEHSAIKPLLKMLLKLHPYLDREIDRHVYEQVAEKLAEETKHARLILDLVEEIEGRTITPRDLPWLPQDRKLARVRARYSKTYASLLHGAGAPSEKEIRRRDEELERAAITLTEGGGGALYQVCSRLAKGGLEKKIAAAFSEIHRDEVGHKDVGARLLARLVRSRRDYERAARIVRLVSSQRLRMRNEQFGFPLTDQEIRSLERECTQPRRRGKSITAA